jgi:hypothetical protein
MDDVQYVPPQVIDLGTLEDLTGNNPAGPGGQDFAMGSNKTG